MNLGHPSVTENPPLDGVTVTIVVDHPVHGTLHIMVPQAASLRFVEEYWIRDEELRLGDVISLENPERIQQLVLAIRPELDPDKNPDGVWVTVDMSEWSRSGI